MGDHPSPIDAERIARAAERWKLTPRQVEVLALVARGCSNHEIAVRIGTGEKTVEAHMTQILKRSARHSRAALIAHFWTGV